jgi:hypothetical protein
VSQPGAEPSPGLRARFRHLVPARLLLARPPRPWPALRSALAKAQAAASGHLHPPIPPARPRRTAANARCRPRLPRPPARHHRSRGSRAPGALQHPGSGLAPALHTAAQVAADARVHGRTRPPGEATSLPACLPDREKEYREHLHENRTESLDFQAPRSVMTRTASTAALAGATTYPPRVTIPGSPCPEARSGRSSDREKTGQRTVRPAGNPLTALLHPIR